MLDKDEFFAKVKEAAQKAIWCALATVHEDQPRVRMVHPTWEGDVLWFATGTGSPKHRQLEKNPNVAIQFQVAPPDFVHLMVSGSVEIVTNPVEKRRVWEVIDYDLSQFWSGGPDDPSYTLVRVSPTRVELSKMYGAMEKKVWHSNGRAVTESTPEAK